eukprot:1184181-Prorocentrum_minimum.AAC.2
MEQPRSGVVTCIRLCAARVAMRDDAEMSKQRHLSSHNVKCQQLSEMSTCWNVEMFELELGN